MIVTTAVHTIWDGEHEHRERTVWPSDLRVPVVGEQMFDLVGGREGVVHDVAWEVAIDGECASFIAVLTVVDRGNPRRLPSGPAKKEEG